MSSASCVCARKTARCRNISGNSTCPQHTFLAHPCTLCINLPTLHTTLEVILRSLGAFESSFRQQTEFYWFQAFWKCGSRHARDAHVSWAYVVMMGAYSCGGKDSGSGAIFTHRYLTSFADVGTWNQQSIFCVPGNVFRWFPSSLRHAKGKCQVVMMTFHNGMKCITVICIGMTSYCKCRYSNRTSGEQADQISTLSNLTTIPALPPPHHTDLHLYLRLHQRHSMSAFLPHPPLPAVSLSHSTTLKCSLAPLEKASHLLLAAAAAVSFSLLPAPVHAAGSGTMKLPPINRSDRNRCSPSSSALGQANAARDSVLDLRECDLRKADLSAYDLSGGIFSGADLSGARLVDAQLSKSYAPNTNFRGTDFTNAVADRVTFDGSDLTDGIFSNAVLSDATFDNANLENVDFTDVYIGDFAQRQICRNPTLKGTNPVTGAPTRESLGCR